MSQFLFLFSDLNHMVKTIINLLDYLVKMVARGLCGQCSARIKDLTTVLRIWHQSGKDGAPT